VVTRRSQPGDKIRARHPRKKQMFAAVVKWVSPTGCTVKVQFYDNTVGYEFPDHEWASGEMSEAAKRWYAQNGKNGFKGAVNQAMEDTEV
jgi:hypothetical protein